MDTGCFSDFLFCFVFDKKKLNWGILFWKIRQVCTLQFCPFLWPKKRWGWKSTRSVPMSTSTHKQPCPSHRSRVVGGCCSLCCTSSRAGPSTPPPPPPSPTATTTGDCQQPCFLCCSHTPRRDRVPRPATLQSLPQLLTSQHQNMTQICPLFFSFFFCHCTDGRECSSCSCKWPLSKIWLFRHFGGLCQTGCGVYKII